MHKPLKLRRVLESREKKSLEDIINFSKIFEKSCKKKKAPKATPPKKRIKNEDRPFTSSEKFKLIKAMEDQLDYFLEHENNGFYFWVKQKNPNASLRSTVEIKKPFVYNTLDPSVILHYNISLPGRKASECYSFYKSYIHPVIKKELALLNLTPSTYVPKGKNTKKFKKNNKFKHIKLVQSIIEVPVYEDIISEDVYCICMKPFIEKTYKKVNETEEDFAKRQYFNNMIECEQCNNWFHYSCMKFTYLQDLPSVFFCPSCKPKKQHLSEDKLD